MPILRERTILGAALREPDEPATVVSHSSDSLIKPKIPKLDFDLSPGNRELAFSPLAADLKMTGPLEISAVRPTDIGPGRFFVCLRQADPTIAKRQPYSVFFDNDSYKGSRQSVIREACETQAYTSIVEPPPPPPAKPDRKR
jgi:hypothetical protein